MLRNWFNIDMNMDWAIIIQLLHVFIHSQGIDNSEVAAKPQSTSFLVFKEVMEECHKVDHTLGLFPKTYEAFFF